MRFLPLLFIALAAAVAHAAIQADEITAMPGFDQPLPSKQYSGFLNVDEAHGRNLHYWFVESENDPAKDPVVLWLNGGPGCSSLDGYFYEQGPLHFVNPEGPFNGSIPKLELNPNRWNKIANMIFLEAPAGVGFSYSNTPSDYNTNDNKTAEDNYQALVTFFKGFPEFSKNRFFVSGESYAGIYVPTLVDQIRLHNDNSSNPFINLEGFLVGNGCIGNSVGACSAQGNEIAIEFLFGHGLYSQALHAQILEKCKDPANPTTQCYDLLMQMGSEVGYVNVYDIYYPCYQGNGERHNLALHKPDNHNANVTAKFLDEWRRSGSLNNRGMRIPPRAVDYFLSPEGPVGCIDGIAASAYLNTEEVRKAIHVQSMSKLPEWTICTGNINYDSNTVSLLPLYPTLAKKYRTLIYNGDVDACVPYVGNEHWTSNLGFPVSAGWKQWMVNKQVAGYVTSYDVPSSTGSFQFITVKGSGHMVPEFRPVQAYAMFERFINKQPF